MRIYAKIGSLNHHHSPEGYQPIPNLDLFAVCLAELKMLSDADGDRHAASLGTESFAEIMRLLGTYAPPFAYFGFDEEDPQRKTDLGFWLRPRPHVLAIQAGLPVFDGRDVTGLSSTLALADEGEGRWNLYWIGDHGMISLWRDRQEREPRFVSFEEAPEAFAVFLPLRFGYVNYRGEFRNRSVRPLSVVWGTTPYHPDIGWHLEAHDLDQDLPRSFLMRDIVTPFSDRSGDGQELLSMGDPLKRGDVLRVIDDQGTLAKIWSAS